jgi:thioredoxin-like negative regulator of GroEL
MRQATKFYTGLAIGVFALAAAGSGITTWMAAPSVRQAVAVHELTKATGANVAAYTQAAFTAAQAAGDPIVIAIHAPWCPTCAAQKPILKQIAAEDAGKNLRVFVVDYDTQKDVVRQFGATMQSTLVMFHGKQEMARSVGDTNADSINASIRRTLI